MKTPPARKTHFICLPLRSLSFQTKVTAFNALLPPTIHQSIVRPVGSLHFTLGVLSLRTPDEIETAVKFLQTCQDDARRLVDNKPVRVRLRGITSMQANVKKASVIYAVPEEGDGVLRALCSMSPILSR